jgi:hypothetical protein
MFLLFPSVNRIMRLLDAVISRCSQQPLPSSSGAKVAVRLSRKTTVVQTNPSSSSLKILSVPQADAQMTKEDKGNATSHDLLTPVQPTEPASSLPWPAVPWGSFPSTPSCLSFLEVSQL